MSQPEHSYFTITDLLTRGWTRAMIRRFLGEPDAMGRSHVHIGGVSHLYDRARVGALELTRDFERAKARAEDRRKVAREAYAEKTQLDAEALLRDPNWIMTHRGSIRMALAQAHNGRVDLVDLDLLTH